MRFLARLPTIPIPTRSCLTGLGLLCLVVGAQGKPLQTSAPGGPAVAESSAVATSSASAPIATPTLTAPLTTSPTAILPGTLTPTLDALDPRTSFNMIIASLQAAGALPSGGRLLFSIPDGYAVTNSSGDNFLPLGGGHTAQDFVLGVQLGWYSIGHGSACGLSFRAGASDWRSVLVTDDGHLLLTRQAGTTRMINAVSYTHLTLPTIYSV